jgi:hypothetical protein
LPSPVQVFDDSVKLLEAAERHGLDGIVSKRQASAYRSGPRPRQHLGELQTGIAAAKIATPRDADRLGVARTLPIRVVCQPICAIATCMERCGVAFPFLLEN